MDDKKSYTPSRLIKDAGIILLILAALSGIYGYYISGEQPEWRLSFNVENRVNMYILILGFTLIGISYLFKKEK